MVPLEFGSDIGGSIRVPSSYNQLVGVRPTVGLASRDGIVPLALSQDTGGPMARTVADAALALDAVVGTDEADPATAERALLGVTLKVCTDGVAKMAAGERAEAQAFARGQFGFTCLVPLSLFAVR